MKYEPPIKYMVTAVQVTQTGCHAYWLKGLVWTAENHRATKFDNPDAAEAALAKSKAFCNLDLCKQAMVVTA